MSKQKAAHIIKEERSWKETWTGASGPAEVTRTAIYFLCGKKWETVKFPEDEIEVVNPSEKLKALLVCQKCQKIRGTK